MTRFRPQSRSSRQPASAGAIERAQPPDEQTYEMLLDALARRRLRLDRLREELTETRRALAAFEGEVQAHVGDLVAELRDVSAEVERARQRLHRLLALAGDAGRDVLEQVVEEIGGGLGVDLDVDDFTGSIDETFDPGPATDVPPPDGHEHPSGPGARDIHDDPATRAQLKRLYRDLARRCHPDLATGEGDRSRREALMQRVNEAFEAGDAETLRSLLLETESDDPAFPERPVEQRLAWARAELARLDRQLDTLRREMTEAQVSDLYRLWRRHATGAPVFEELEADLEVRIRQETRLLDRLVAGFRAVVSDERLDDEIEAMSPAP